MRCPALMNGYHNLPEATRAALTEDGFYITSDVFRRDGEGFCYFIGRADDMFVSGSENIYPGEVEKMLERHPDIHQAVVVPIDDERKFKKAVAFVVPRPGAAPSEEAIKQFTLKNAAPYLHPRRVWLVAEMPLAGTNKIDRCALAARAAQMLSRPRENSVFIQHRRPRESGDPGKCLKSLDSRLRGNDGKRARNGWIWTFQMAAVATVDLVEAIYARYGKPARRGPGSDRGVDVVVNYTGGDTWTKSLPILRVGRRLLTCGATAGYDPPEDIRYIWTFELQILGSKGWAREDLTALLDLVQSGKLQAVIDEVLPLERAAEGLMRLENRQVFGKLVVTP